MIELLLWLVAIIVYQVSKKLWIDQKYTTLWIALVLWVWYFFYTSFLDAQLQENIATSVTAIIGTSKVVYDFITTLLAWRTQQ